MPARCHSTDGEGLLEEAARSPEIEMIESHRNRPASRTWKRLLDRLRIEIAACFGAAPCIREVEETARSPEKRDLCMMYGHPLKEAPRAVEEAARSSERRGFACERGCSVV